MARKTINMEIREDLATIKEELRNVVGWLKDINEKIRIQNGRVKHNEGKIADLKTSVALLKQKDGFTDEKIKKFETNIITKIKEGREEWTKKWGLILAIAGTILIFLMNLFSDKLKTIIFGG